MTLEEAAAEIGGLVEYRDAHSQPGDSGDHGLIARVVGPYVFVRYHLGDTAEACAPALLTLRVHAAVQS